MLEFKLRQAGRVDFVGHDDVFAPLDVVVEEADVATGGVDSFEMSSFNARTTRARDARIAASSRGGEH